MNILDVYTKTAPTPQNTIDIFKGEWSSRLSNELGQLEAGGAALFDDGRIKWAAEKVGQVAGKKVLELGPLEAGHTYMLEKMGAASIIAIEANSRAYLKCLVIKELFKLKAAHFLYGDFVEYLRTNSKRFDICLASGVLYHMRNPPELIQLISNTSDTVIIWTHYFDEEVLSKRTDLWPKFSPGESAEHAGFSHTLYHYEYLAALNWQGFCGGSAEFSNWMSREDILNCLRHFGFKNIEIGLENKEHPNGPCFTLVASRLATTPEVGMVARLRTKFNQLRTWLKKPLVQ